MCIGSTTTFTDATPGGVWTTATPAIASVGASTGIVTGLSAGSAIISYTIGACSVSKKIIVYSCTGTIAGKVGTGAGKGTSGTAPVQGMMIQVKDASTNDVIAQSYTNAGGNYTFNGLGDGSYYIYPTAVGYVTTPSGTIVISSTVNQVTGIDFNVHEGSKTISPIGSTGVEELPTAVRFDVFPNPTTGMINIAWNNQVVGNASVVVTDVVGREVSHAAINGTTPSGNVQVNLSELKEGIYMIMIKSESVNYTSQIYIRK